MPPDSPAPGTPQHWLARANGHLAIARQGKPAAGFWEDLAFHAQQAAEFALKAVYQQRGLLFRYTHNLEELGKGLEDAGVSVPPTIKDAVILTKFAVRARYPGAGAPVTRSEHEDAVRLAESVLAWAQTQVPDTDLPV